MTARIHLEIAASEEFALFPFLGIIVLMWILAYSRWPAERNVPDVFA